MQRTASSGETRAGDRVTPVHCSQCYGQFCAVSERRASCVIAQNAMPDVTSTNGHCDAQASCGETRAGDPATLVHCCQCYRQFCVVLKRRASCFFAPNAMSADTGTGRHCKARHNVKKLGRRSDHSGALRQCPGPSAWVLNRRSPCISAPNAGPDATSTGVPVQRVASWGETCARDRATLVLAAYVPGPFRLFVRRGRFRAPAPDALPAGTGAGDIEPCGSVRRYPG